MSVLRGVVRLVGLGLTLVLMIQFSVVVADMLVVQCFGEPECLKTWTLIQWLRENPWWSAVLVLVVLAVPVFVGAQITAQSRNALNPDGAITSANTPADAMAVPKLGPDPNIAAPDFYERGSAVSARTLHGAVALAGVSLLLSGGWVPLPSLAAKLTWGVSAALIVLGLGCAALLDDPRGSGGRFSGGRTVITLLGGTTRFRAIWWGLAALNLVVAAPFSFRPIIKDAPDQWRSGVDALVEWTFVGLAILCAAAFVTAALAARRSRRAYFTSVPVVFRPWLFVESDEDTLAIVMPKNYDAIALLWGITAVVAVGLAIVVGVSSFWYAKTSGRFWVPQLLQGKSMAVAWFSAGVKVRAARILFTLVTVAVIAGAVSALAIDTLFAARVRDTGWLEAIFQATGLRWLADTLKTYDGGDVSRMVQGVGLLALAAVVIGLLYAIYNAYRRPDSTGRSLGVLWDLASFWPTESHPLVPPCYARKAIEDITTRVRCYRACHPNARIMLCGHSQGSLLTYATVLRLAILDLANADSDTRILAKVGLVTHGSQLQWAYGRAFPDMLSYYSHQTVMRALDGRWYNLVRFTDPLGGPVLSWDLEVKGAQIVGAWLPGEPTTPQTFVRTTSGARVIGHERWLPDPVLNQPIFPARKHSDYTLDPQWDAAVTLAAGLEPASADIAPAGVEAEDPR